MAIIVIANRFGKIRNTFMISERPKRKAVEILPARAAHRQKTIL